MKVFVLFMLLIFASCLVVAQKADYEVYAIRFTPIANTPLSYWVNNSNATKDSIEICYMFWLIKGNHQNILVDAGYLRDFADSSMKTFVRPDSMLLAMGLQAKDITDIILTHPHWDHIDGVDLYPNAHVWMQKEDFTYFVSTAWQKGGNHEAFTRRDVRKLIEISLAGRLTLVEGDDKELFPGVRVYTGSRHTFNSQYVLVSNEKSKVVLASDNIWTYYNLEHLISVPPYGTFDTTAYVQAMKRMKTMVSDNKYIIPGHDARVFSLFPTVKEGIVRIE